MDPYRRYPPTVQRPITPEHHVGWLMSIFDSPNGCFFRWAFTAMVLIVVIVFVWLARNELQNVADRGGVRLTSSEKATRNFLMVLLFFLVSYLFFSLYKMVDCYL